MGNKNRRNRGNNQGNRQQAQTPVERIKFLYNGSRQKELIDVLVDDSIVRNNPKLIVELSSEFVVPVLGMGLMEDLIDTEAEMLCSRMVLQAIKDFRSFHNDVDNMERIFNRLARDAVNNSEFESLGDDLFTAIQASFPDVTDADAMRLAIYVFTNSTLKSILDINDDIQIDENIEVSASTSTAEPDGEKTDTEGKIETEEVPLIENKEKEPETVIDVECREVPESDNESETNSTSTTVPNEELETAVMTKLLEISDAAVKNSLSEIKDFTQSETIKSNCDEIPDSVIIDIIKSVTESVVSKGMSPDEILSEKPDDILKNKSADIVSTIMGQLVTYAIKHQIMKEQKEQAQEQAQQEPEQKEEEDDGFSTFIETITHSDGTVDKYTHRVPKGSEREKAFLKFIHG